MKRKFLVPVVSAITSLLGHQACASLAPATTSSDASTVAAWGNDDPAHKTFSTLAPGAVSEFSVFDNGEEYLFLMQRSENGVLSAYHSSHRSHSSHSSHSSHRSHYSSR